MKDQNCPYCMGREACRDFGVYICHLGVSVLYLFREQSHPGRCVVAYKDHVSELVDLTDQERSAYFEDVARAAKAIHAAFQPNKVNYGAYDDGGGHLHFHLVPKYQFEFEWEEAFAVDPGKRYLADEEYTVLVEMIKAGL